MKNANFSKTLSALFLTAAAIAVAPSATAAESKAIDDIQKTRLEVLSNSTKAVDDIQKTRLAVLESSTKSVDSIQEVRLAQLDNPTKAVEDIQKTRLDFLTHQTKGVDDAWGDDFAGKTSRSTVGIQF